MNKERSFLYIGGSVFVAILVLLFLARPAYQDMIKAKQDFDAQQANLASLAQQIKDTNQVASDYKNTSSDKIALLNKHLPNTADEATFVAQMEAMGKATHALVSGIDFSDATTTDKKSLVTEVNVTLTVTGSFSQIVDLIGSLEQNVRISTLHDITMQTRGKDLSARITLSTYYQAGGAKQSNSKVENTTSKIVTF
jgi:Tfp pilus assembly protein PilO